MTIPSSDLFSPTIVDGLKRVDFFLKIAVFLESDVTKWNLHINPDTFLEHAQNRYSIELGQVLLLEKDHLFSNISKSG